jgi:hypothetical protein
MRRFWHNGKLLPWWVSITQTWGRRPGNGRFWKRMLSKVRRRAWKDDHERGLSQLESRVNWRDW